ncbi:nucleotidyltransferase domain-containing protein [bacterium]|nr:nucleotidyltransferase domain-containing protein [bacterium]
MKNIAEILSHLPENKIKELEIVTRKIVETGMASMVVLYGSYARGDWKEKPGGRSGKKSDYDIMVLAKDERDCQDLKNKLIKLFENFPTVVQTMVEKLGFVNMHLREGQYFFTEIKQQGIILYAESNTELAEAENLSPTRLREIVELDFKQWFGQAEGFLDHYFLDVKKLRYNLASFQLQQCVENCYTAIEMVYSRNNPYEHRLTIITDECQTLCP